MVQAELRSYGRTALLAGDPGEEAALLRERIRLGYPLGALRVAALCGHAEAQRRLDLLPEFLATTEEVANLFAVGDEAVRSWRHEGCPYRRYRGRRRFDLGRVFTWRVNRDLEWAPRHALETWAGLVARWVGPAVTRHALTRAVSLLEARWTPLLTPAGNAAARDLLEACCAEPPVASEVREARRALNAALPPRHTWQEATFPALLPLGRLADACLDAADGNLLAQLARSVVAGLAAGGELDPALARTALDVCQFALDPWCQRELAS